MSSDTRRHAPRVAQEHPPEDSPAEAGPSVRDALYRGLVEESLQGILVYRHMRPVFANRAMARMLGYDQPHELLALESLAPLIARADRPMIAKLRRQNAAGHGVPEVTEVACVRKDGSIANLRAFSRLVDWMGEPAVHSTLIDVTEQRLAEQALREREALYRDLVEGSLQGIVIHRNRRFLFVNRAYAKALGYATPEEVMALPSIDDVVPEPDRTRLREYSERRLRGEALPPIYETASLRKDGSRVEFQVYSRMIQWLGAPAIQSTLIDLTGQRRAQEELRQKEWELSRAQQAANIGSWYRNLHTAEMRWSDQTCLIFGQDPATFSPNLETFMSQVYPDDRPLIMSLAQARRIVGGHYEFEHRMVRTDGAIRTLRTIGDVLYDDAGEPEAIIGTLQDITERRATEQRLAQAQKLEALGRLSGGVAHDFNNLLTIIHGNLELALLSLDDPSRLRPVLQTVLDAARRGADLTRLMLAYSRRQPLSPRVEDVQRIVGNVGKLLRRSLRESIELELVPVAEPLWPVRIDAGQLESAIINLAINARDAMPDGGRLSIRARNLDVSPTGVPDSTEVPPGQYVVLTVSDTGTGIDPGLLDKVFEPFFTTKEAGKGSGMGLSTVYGFIRQSGGHIRLHSEPNQGTTVTLFLPRHPGTPPQPAVGTPARPDPGPARGRGHVLVVEDEPEIRRIAERIFRDLGFSVVAVPDGAAALAYWNQGRPVDLLFTDMVLPGQPDGLALADSLRRRVPGLPVLIATGYAENLEALQSRLEEGYVLVEKPYSGSVIAERLRACGLLHPSGAPTGSGPAD